MLLHALLEQQAQALAAGGGLFGLEPLGLAGRARVLIARPGVVVHARIRLDGLLHGHARPLLAQADDLALIGHVGGRKHLHGDEAVQLLDKVHHAEVVRVGLIHLHGGELGVVARVHALVAEDAPDLVHALQAAHDQPLEV